MRVESLSGGRVMAIGALLAAFLALTVSGQLYLSMLSHGHSFVRMYVAELARWLFWAIAAPSVLRAGAGLAPSSARTRPKILRVVRLATMLIALHALFS